jgi:hypothetical protein
LRPVQLVENRLENAMTEPLFAVIRLQADTIGLQRIEGIFDFLERPVDVEHR